MYPELAGDQRAQRSWHGPAESALIGRRGGCRRHRHGGCSDRGTIELSAEEISADPCSMKLWRWGVAVGVAACGAAAVVLTGGDQRGIASYYGEQFQGRPTASGEPFDLRAMTAAHRTLAFGTRVRVVNLDNGKDVVVRINDRGPFVAGRIIDVSEGAAEKLGMVKAGLARVRLAIETRE